MITDKIMILKTYNISIYFLLNFVFLSILTTAYAESTSVIQDTLRIPDKLYITTDKPYYTVEETIFFKFYQLDGQTHVPHSLDNFASIELINEQNRTVFSYPIKIKDGFSSGSIYLPDTLKGGSYKIIGYNNWSKTFPRSFIYSKPIEIVNYFVTPAHTSNEIKSISLRKKEGQTFVPEVIEKENSGTLIQFFPEGGSMIENLFSRVAFTAVDGGGNGKLVNGKVIDSSGKEILAFSSNAFGMGSFSLKPEPGNSYFAIINKDSVNSKTKLPMPLKEGFVLAIDPSEGESIKVKVNSKLDINNINEGFFVIEATARGQVLYTQKVRLQVQEVKIEIPTYNFPTAIIQITLYYQNQPRAERLCFVEQKSGISVKLSANKTVYSPKEKVELELEVKDTYGNPVSGNFTLSAVDANQLTEAENVNNLFSYLYLTSEIKGKIKQPYHYFSQDTSNRKKDLDLLLLTQGWRNYSWQKLSALNFSKTETRGKAPSILGRVVDLNGKPSAHASIIVTYPGNSSNFFYTAADANGEFVFPVTHAGTKELVVTTKSANIKNEELRVTFKNNDMKHFGNELKNDLDWAAFKNYFVTTQKLVRIKEAFKDPDSTKQVSKYIENKTLNEFEQNANPLIKLADFQSFVSMKEVIQEIVPGFKFKKTKEGLEVRLLSLDNKLFYTGEPLYFIDNIMVNSLQDILALEPSIVENVVLIRERIKLEKFGPLAIDGIFAVHTIDRNYTMQNLKNTVYLNYSGFSTMKEFYSPHYNQAVSERSQPDFRPVLFWNPEVKTDAEGKAKITYYNSDAIGPVRVIVEGISLKGIPGVSQLQYEVKMNQ